MGALCSQPLPNLFAQLDCGLASPHTPHPPPTRPRPHLEAGSKGGRMKGVVLHLLRSSRRGLCQPWEELAQRDPGLPLAHPSGALPTLMSVGFRPHWSAGFCLSLTHTHQVGLSEKEVKSQRVRLRVGGPEVQISRGTPESEAARLPASIPSQARGRKECPVGPQEPTAEFWPGSAVC